MDWNNCYSHRRVLNPEKEEPISHRSAFSRDADRIIFSTPFRRLQDKTQIFSLPGSAFVHNRLTHSLEVAAVGRSLGAISGSELARTLKTDLSSSSKEFYKYQLSEVIYAACLAHDIGNPAFGHSGEDAICSFFKNNQHTVIADGCTLKSYFEHREWSDLIHFEGNANAIRMLAGERKGVEPRDLNPTITSLVTLAKYPCESIASQGKKGPIHRKKFGFLQKEKSLFQKCAEVLDMEVESENPLAFKRHPFVYLLEAADDICYSIVDLEDAARLRILPFQQVCDILRDLIGEVEGKSSLDGIDGYIQRYVEEPEKQLSFLRSKCIGLLIKGCSSAFIRRHEQILRGELNQSLIDVQEESVRDSMKYIRRLSNERIYNSESVIKMELAGYRIFSDLLELFVPALLKTTPDAREEKILKIIPSTYRPRQEETPYTRMIYLIDYLSSMTDNYALELYRNVMGIDLPRH
ncbi:MAG: dNTP triphosphohydrolase [Saprospirales bacterium]|nr:MAG: dNTP triphosphohydrolase [Saprospirales bacterium]